MEIKKTAKADLEGKKALFLEIGLIVSMLLVILMFGWSQKEKVIQTMTGNSAVIEEEITEITIQEKQPEQQPQVKTLQAAADVLQILKDDTKITTEFSFTDDFSDDPFEISPIKREEVVVEEEKPLLRAEVMPTFEGGDLNTFRNWVQKALEGKYPTIAAENNISGTVNLSFVVDATGSIANIEIASSPHSSLSEAAIKAMQSAPKWKPGSQRGKPVKVKFSMPVKFVLN